MMGFIVDRILTHQPIDNKDVQEWAKEVLKVECGTTLIREITNEMGFSMKRSQVKRTGYTLDRDASARKYLTFLLEKARPIFANNCRNLIGSIDLHTPVIEKILRRNYPSEESKFFFSYFLYTLSSVSWSVFCHLWLGRKKMFK